MVFAVIKSCNNMDNSFIDKYGKSSFDEFQHYKIFTPGFTRSNAPVFFIEEINNPMQIRYVVELNSDRNSIKEMRKELIRDTVATDGIIGNMAQLSSMALKFNELNIYSLKVDESRNVFVKQKAIEQDKQIVRFAEPKTIDANKWVLIKDNWYQEK